MTKNQINNFGNKNADVRLLNFETSRKKIVEQIFSLSFLLV